MLEHHIIPALGTRSLHDVSGTDIKRLIAEWLVQGNKNRTIHNILTPLREAYQHTIDNGLVTANPVANMGGRSDPATRSTLISTLILIRSLLKSPGRPPTGAPHGIPCSVPSSSMQYAQRCDGGCLGSMGRSRLLRSVH